MAHLKKFSASALGHMLGHYDRTKDNLGDNIDPTRTHLNYNLAAEDQPMNQLDFIHKRKSEVKCQNRADVKLMCTWVVTLPSSVKKGDEGRFFALCYTFLTDKYGRDNVISAYVHVDETTPHMHYAFCPVVADRKHEGKFKFSAKECITRSDLRSIHQKMNDWVSDRMGYDVGIINAATAEGNRSIEELKRKTATETVREIKDLKFENESLGDVVEHLNDVVDDYVGNYVPKKELDAATVELASKEQQIADLERENARLRAENGVFRRFIDDLGLGGVFDEFRDIMQHGVDFLHQKVGMMKYHLLHDVLHQLDDPYTVLDDLYVDLDGFDDDSDDFG